MAYPLKNNEGTGDDPSLSSTPGFGSSLHAFQRMLGKEAKNQTNKRSFERSIDQPSGQWVSKALVKLRPVESQNHENTQDLASSIKYGAKEP